MVEELLRKYKEPLAEKNILTKQDLVKIIRIDYEKIYSSLIELRTKNAAAILDEFFFENDETVPAILDKLKKKELCHIGFEIYEPLDLVLQGLNHVFEKLSRKFGAKFTVLKVFRFPASDSFQTRVNAFTEIMRIWIEFHGRELMLEMFDIHRPVEIFALDKKHRFNKRNAVIPSVASEEYYVVRESRSNTFSRDNIWHYAMHVGSPEEVTRMQDYFRTFVVGRDAYTLPFENIVHNKNDGSFYSKIVNTKKGLELEFVTTVEQ